jgi:hypothetical protein
VRVPSEAGDGVAKITVSIPEWKKALLAPATFAVPLNADSQKIHAAQRWNERHP